MSLSPGLAHAERLAAGQACLKAALMFLALDITPLCCCDPGHIAVGKAHAKICKPRDYGKVPMVLWKDLQGRIPLAAEVHQWWKQYPLGNLGIILGQGSGVVRIDSDGEAGATLLAQWSAGDLPDTWTFLSPSGGQGWLYGWPKDLPCKTTATATQGTAHEELRLMANGSQTIVPPSRHQNGGVYTWVPAHSPSDIALAPAPQWLRERLYQPVAERTTSPYAGPRTAEYDRVMAALAHLPNNDAPYDDWLKTGMALHSTGAPWAREAWDTWSQGSTKFDPDKQEKSWASFVPGAPGRTRGDITVAWIFHKAYPSQPQTERTIPDMTRPRTEQASSGHVLPEYLANHPDPRVRRHWARVYQRTNAHKRRLQRDPYASLASLTHEGA